MPCRSGTTARFAAALRAYINGSDEGVPDLRSEWNAAEAPASRPRPDPERRRYRPIGGPSDRRRQLLAQPRIVTILDHDGNILAQDEMIPGSSHLEPVNWRGDGQEFALLSGNVREGHGRRGPAACRDVPRRRPPGPVGRAGRDGRSARRDRSLGSAAGLDLHAGSALQRLADFAPLRQSALQRFELPGVGVAPGLGAAAVARDREPGNRRMTRFRWSSNARRSCRTEPTWFHSPTLP